MQQEIIQDVYDFREVDFVMANPFQNIRKHVNERGCMCQLIILFVDKDTGQIRVPVQ